jgi:antitoxin VapB
MVRRAREHLSAYVIMPAAGTSEPSVRAKLFANGRSQAVRLPKEFRLPGSEVLIHREGDRVILEPVKDIARDAKGWPVDLWKWLDQSHEPFPDPEPMPVALLEPVAIEPLDVAARSTRQTRSRQARATKKSR